MIRSFTLLLLASLARAQSADAALTQTLIAEIRALRQDLEATNVTAQRVQIALYRLQSQTAIVNTALQRVDAARTRVAETESQHQGLAAQIRRYEEAGPGALSDQEKSEMQQNLPRVKAVLESLAAEEAARRSAQVDAEQRLRAEQARLTDLEALLDRLDRALDELARPKR